MLSRYSTIYLDVTVTHEHLNGTRERSPLAPTVQVNPFWNMAEEIGTFLNPQDRRSAAERDAAVQDAIDRVMRVPPRLRRQVAVIEAQSPMSPPSRDENNNELQQPGSPDEGMPSENGSFRGPHTPRGSPTLPISLAAVSWEFTLLNLAVITHDRYPVSAPQSPQGRDSRGAALSALSAREVCRSNL